ncbi:MAG: hypothetical protein A2X28_00760 [Elusimicrobia bacterium GWA2_56_46]|nr:MAG: hypothetical protein A2X28_00760 [Elusimicrobia bacterium GWA2_56_46]OGR55895.1 MAG: hypothetical protein A2X39_06125 [Elusimicrobia bacterium GWC2_56_31]HBB67550.1 hypothetical protein [Elusimicrobiota bacterium]HBW22170.1 hypothetical protein [Elusimicrobiota bacterium]
MIKLLFSILLLSGCGGANDGAREAPGRERPAAKTDEKPGVAAERFACETPSGWEIKRDREKEKKTKILKLELVGPREGNAPVLIYAAFYGTGNASFSDHADFIERNSKNILGETQSDTEKFSPVKETSLAGKKTFEFDSEIKEYLNPESKSAESVVIKEKFYVIPAKDGFFVLHYYAPAPAYNKYLPVFKKLTATFKIL